MVCGGVVVVGYEFYGFFFFFFCDFGGWGLRWSIVMASGSGCG